MPPKEKLKLRIERFLYKKGFTDAPLRAIILAQLALVCASLVSGLILLYFSAWPICFFLGAALICLNFWSMSRFIFEHMPGGYSKTFLQGQIFRFMGRVILTGVVLGLALYFGASPWPLVLGMNACLAVTGIVGVARLRGK